jgi:hypothetical protein
METIHVEQELWTEEIVQYKAFMFAPWKWLYYATVILKKNFARRVLHYQFVVVSCGVRDKIKE